MYANGYDLRHFMTTAISPAIAEAILWTYHGVRAYGDNSESGKTGISEKLKRDADAGPHPFSTWICKHPQNSVAWLESYGDQPRPISDTRAADALTGETRCRARPHGTGFTARRVGKVTRRRE